MVRSGILAVIILVFQVFAFDTTPTLVNLGDTTLMEIPNTDSIGNRRIAADILDFGGMAYDHHRHKILVQGGGHSTSYPSEVVEFDFATLTWSYLMDPVDCGVAYTAANALMTASNEKLGGFTYNGLTYAGSRHTYDGIEMAPDTNILVLGQSFEFKGCVALSNTIYETYYKGGSGLFTLDPAAGEWEVSDEAGLAMPYCYSAFNPQEPDWLYYGNSGYTSEFFKLNWKTHEKVQMASRPSGSRLVDHSMTYCPVTHSFYSFPCGSSGGNANVFRYDLLAGTWHTMNPAGPAPNTYSINVVWDSKNGVFACFDNSTDDFCYYSPVENRWYQIDQDHNMARLFHHHIYDPVNNVHIMIGRESWHWKTYAYKFSDTPGEFPGTAVETRTGIRTGAVIGVSPNPCVTGARIILCSKFKMQSSKFKIYNTSGRLIRDLSKELGNARNISLRWDGRDFQGRPVSAGVYILRLTGAGTVSQVKLAMVK
jgi:hypothetical protein